MTKEIAIKIFNEVLLFGKARCTQAEFKELAEMSIKALEQEPQTFKWCDTCKEYDQEKHCCHRWSKVIRNTFEEMKQEQEPRKGHWICDGKGRSFADYHCSECGLKLALCGQDIKQRQDSGYSLFCGGCGADMREVVEE